MTSDYPKGSEWRKWDLHVHSPLSILNNQFPKIRDGEPDWEPFLQKLESLDVAVIGLTDYFTIEGYKALKEFKPGDRLKNIHTILPNIEFRLKNIVSSRSAGERRLSLHVIFSEEVPVEDIEEHFLHDIPFYYQGAAQNRDESRKLKTANLASLGQELMEQHDTFRNAGASPLAIGAMQAVVDHEEITKLLMEDSRFKGKYVMVLEADDWDQIDWDGQAHLVRKSLLQKSDMLFSSNRSSQQWCLGKNPYKEGIDHFIREFTTLKPCIHGSDAHKVEDIGRPCAKRGDANHSCDDDPSGCALRYCWIKADPTFEGLKQLLYEPEERVAIQDGDPSPVISNYTITRVSVGGAVVNDELSIADADFHLNPFLVAVVGGKGAGKTALVDLVANCYMDREAADDKNSFVKRVAEYEPEISTFLSFKGSGNFAKTLAEQKFYDDGQIIYIAQGELEQYIGERSDLHQRIRELIFDDTRVKNSALSFDYDEAITTTEELEKKIVVKNQVIETLEAATSLDNSRALKKERTRVESDLKDIGRRVEEVEKVQGKSDTEAAKRRQEQLGVLKYRHENLTALRDAVEKALELLESNVEEFNELVRVANELMRQLKIGGDFEELKYSYKAKLEKVLGSVKSQTRATVSKIEKEQKELGRLEHGVKEHAKLLERRRELETSLRAVEKKTKQFEEDTKKLQTTETERKGFLKALVQSILAQKSKYKKIIKVFSDKKAEVLSDIDFVAQVLFDEKAFLEEAESILDNRKIELTGDGRNPAAFDSFVGLMHAIADGNGHKVDDLVGEVERCNKEYKTRIKSGPVTTADLYDLLYGNYMRVVPVVRYKKTDLEKLSLGQKATVLLKIYLAHGDKPIIIDSHDDHLDNEFIMDELVNAIRQAKNYRQVILVSNNGNVVINSDAEQILVAGRIDGEITYVSGAIENPTIRDRALGVLEGGSEAFQKRQQKYRLGF